MAHSCNSRLDRGRAKRLHAGSMTRRLLGLGGAIAAVMAVLGLLAGTAVRGASDPNLGWIEVRSPHFVVSSNAGEKEARRIADQFEQIRGLFLAAFGNLKVDPAQPVLIV